MLAFLATLALIGITVYYFTVLRKKWSDEKARQLKELAKKQSAQQNVKKEKHTKNPNTTTQSAPHTEQNQSSTQTEQKVKNLKKKDHLSTKINHKNIEHELYQGAVKGFAGEITDYDYNHEFLVVSSKDKHIRVFKLNDLCANQVYYFSVEFGYPTAVAISPDSKYIAYAINIDKSIELRGFDLSNPDIKKRTTSPKIFAKDCHKEEIQKLSFDVNNKFIISSACNSDTFVKIWSLQGKELSSYNTGHNTHYMARYSQQRKFYFFASWTSNFKTLTFVTDKTTHDFKQIQKAYGLSHGASINYVNSDNLDEKAITISKNEKCVKFWDINVNYQAMVDPKVIKQFKGEAEQKVLFDGKDQLCVAGAIHNAEGKVFYSLSNGEDVVLLDQEFNKIQLFKDVFTPEYFINRVEFISPNDSTLLLVFGSLEEGRFSVFNISKYLN
ncbi:hypothetical protein ABPG74_002266 [Tetrahymena malaccensis]